MRILKRQLSDVVWKRMVADVQRRERDHVGVTDAAPSADALALT